jgi:arylsulfatase
MREIHMPDERPNIILILTDQERYDTIGALGYPWMKTPNLDRLVNEGVAFTKCYCTAPSCVPSRASFFNLQYPHDMGVYDNSFEWRTSWVEWLRDSGYFTVNIGKMHTVPNDAECGFDKRFVVENKDRPHCDSFFYDEWDKFLRSSGQRKPSRWHYREEHPEYNSRLGAFTWPLEDQYHPDVFVGTMARWFLEEEEEDKPLFLQVGFPGPHPPYDPPERYLRMYDDVDIPVPEIDDEDLALQHVQHNAYRREMIDGNHDAVKWNERPTKEQLLRLRRHYAANMTLIDDEIGKILDLLEKKGRLENSIVVFTSDHGDCLGDHNHIQKWTMYEEIVRVPTVAWSPGNLPAGKKVDGLVQQFDIAQMLLDMAGVETPEFNHAISPMPMITDNAPGRDAVFAEHSVTPHMREISIETMIRTENWKLVHCLDRKFGELYDLENDPREVRNAWDNPEYADMKHELLDMIRDWRIRLPDPMAKRLHHYAQVWRENK